MNYHDGVHIERSPNEACAMTTFCSQFLRDESGATAIEYGLIVAGIAVAILASIQALSTSVKEMLFDAVVEAMS
jgi:pilus assembly protein Flp/PilA